ncbi:MAG: hypothetical protein ACRCXC_02605 [Legionella sp.]
MNDPELLQAAKLLPAQGTLQVSDECYVYLKISDDYVNVLYPILLKHSAAKDAPCLVPDRNSLGGHIILFYADSLDLGKLQTLPIGKTFDFQIEKIEKVTTKKRWHQQEEKRVWYVLLINYPTLASTVKQIASSKTYKKTFHISIAREDYNPQGFCIHHHTFYHKRVRVNY